MPPVKRMLHADARQFALNQRKQVMRARLQALRLILQREPRADALAFPQRQFDDAVLGGRFGQHRAELLFNSTASAKLMRRKCARSLREVIAAQADGRSKLQSVAEIDHQFRRLRADIEQRDAFRAVLGKPGGIASGESFETVSSTLKMTLVDRANKSVVLHAWRL